MVQVTNVNWLQASALNGSGNATLDFNADAHTGRSPRTATLQVTSGNLAQTINVSQLAHDAFLTLASNAQAIQKAGQVVTITATSNIGSFYVLPSLKSSGISAKIPTTVLSTATVELADGTALTRDSTGKINMGTVGEDAQYTVKVKITIPENTTVNERGLAIVFSKTTAQNPSDIWGTFTITQSAGDATLSVSSNNVTFNADGTAATTDSDKVDVVSNTTWSLVTD